MSDLGMNVSSESRGDIERVVHDLRQAVTSDDTGKIHKLTEDLQMRANQLGQASQAQSQPQQDFPYDSPEPQGERPRDHGDVVEGQFHEE